MTRMSRIAAAPAAVLLALAAFILAGGLAGCGAGGGGGVQSSIHGTSQEQADRLYARLERENFYQREVQVLDLVHSFLDYHPDDPRVDAALAMGVAAALRLDDYGQALSLLDERIGRAATPDRAARIGLEASQTAAAGRDTVRAARYLLAATAADPSAGAPGLVEQAAPLLDALAADDLASLLPGREASPLWSYTAYRAVRAHALAGQPQQAAAALAMLEGAAPDDLWTAEARAVLQDTQAGGRPLRRLGPAPVRPNVIGVICPLTGRYAMLGNAFVDAALMAVAAAGQETGLHFELRVEDSGGDPVPAALAARRLIVEEGCLALLGALTSAPTAAVALVADQYGVPLVSPTATSDRLWELGPAVFQTNLTSVHEIQVLAELAVRVLLKERFAILYPDSPEGERQAELFRAAVEGWGGGIVASEPFPERATDFQAPILSVRRERPEVLFVPATVDQMSLLGPQLDFHRMGALVMGLSNFKSERLVERTGLVIDGVVCPDDLALFPPAWTAEFTEGWQGDAYPREATGLALKAYQATRMLLDTTVADRAADRASLTAALRRRLTSDDTQAEGPEAFVRSVRVVREGRFVPFPGELYSEAWALEQAAQADSLAAAAADSVKAETPVRE